MLHAFDHSLFAHHSGKDDEGNIHAALLQELQRLQCAKRWQDIIRKDDVRPGLELAAVLLLIVYALAPGLDASALQSPHHEVEVHSFVFDDQHRKGVKHENDSL